MSHWIAISKQLPPVNERVKLKRELGNNDINRWESEGYILKGGTFSVKKVPEITSFENTKPTHWMPLPEPPKQ